MSIPQPQIIYTGLNAARPDFKTMTRDINARMDMIRREKQQQRQFDRQRQDQLNREFLKSVDMDRLNFTQGQFQQASSDIYQAFDDTVAGMVESRKGEMSVQDMMKAQALASRAEQEVMKYKGWENNWIADQKAYLADPTRYKESSRDAIFNYDGSTPYNESKLEIAPWDTFTTQQEMKQWTDDANKLSTFSYMNGQGDVQSSGDWTVKFWQTTGSGESLRPVFDKNGNPIPNYEEQGKFVKGLLNGRDFTQARQGVVERFNALSSDKQKIWDDMALRNGLSTKGQGDGEIMYFMHPDGENSNPFDLGVKQKAYKETSKSGKDKTKEIVTVDTGTGDMGGNPVKYTGRVQGAMGVGGEEVDVLKGLNDVWFTQIDYMENPKTGKNEWMVRGVYEEKSGSGTTFGYDEQGRPTMQTGGGVQAVEFLVPYGNVKETIEKEYRVQGMENFKEPEVEDTKDPLGLGI